MKVQSSPNAAPSKLKLAKPTPAFHVLGPNAWSKEPLPIALALAAVLWAITFGAVWRECGGAAVPLDDAYIHFTYARSIAELTPLVYSPGSPPTAGSTSLLWPMLLAIPYGLGAKGMAIIGWATTLGFLGLALVAREAVLLARGLVSERFALTAGALTLVFGANIWFAASGMEVLPFAWVLAMAARKSIEWIEANATHRFDPRVRPLLELLALAVSAPLFRPEGAWVSLLIATVIAIRPRHWGRSPALFAIAAIAAPGAVLYALTGEIRTTTATAKWLPLNPYYQGHVAQMIAANVELLFRSVLNGHDWVPMFLPAGVAPLLCAGLGALLIRGLSSKRLARAVILLWLAAGILIPTSYETFLSNRLRYIWPFFTPFFVGLTALAACATQAFEALRFRRASSAAWGIAGVFACGLGMKLPAAISDLRVSAHAINQQQVSLALWAKNTLPTSALIGVNDAGALTYLSARRTFDVVGLTTPNEARYWVMGAGSRFEHYERLGAAHLPTHFVVYPEWFQNDILLGERLTEREVAATILGGQRMVAYVADYSALSTAELPTASNSSTEIVDRLDVADLESESAHDYRLFSGNRETNRVFVKGHRADGGRTHRTQERFRLQFAGECSLVLRVASDVEVELAVFVEQEWIGSVSTSAELGWEEHRVAIPQDYCSGSHTIEVSSPDGAPFAALSYWSLRD